MKNAAQGLGAIPTFAFWLLNAFGGFVGGLWLIFAGDWKVVILSLLAGTIFPFVYSIIAMIVQMPLVGLGSYFLKRKIKIIAYPIFYIPILLLDVLAIVWIFSSFNWVLHAGSSSHIFPFLLVAYSLAVSPYSYMARGEDPDSIGTNMGVAFVVFAAILHGIGWFFYAHPAVGTITTVLIVILMLFKQFFQFAALNAIQKAEVQAEAVAQI